MHTHFEFCGNLIRLSNFNRFHQNFRRQTVRLKPQRTAYWKALSIVKIFTTLFFFSRLPVHSYVVHLAHLEACLSSRFILDWDSPAWNEVSPLCGLCLCVFISCDVKHNRRWGLAFPVWKGGCDFFLKSVLDFLDNMFKCPFIYIMDCLTYSFLGL